MKYLSYLLLIITVGFNLYLNYPETKILADPNDNVFQYSLVVRTDWVWKNYGCPLSLPCLPNLVDHNVTAWAEGYPLPFYYPHIPQITIVASYNLFIKPLFSFISYPLSLYQYYNWTKFLFLTLFPIPVFIALRIVGFSPILAVLGAFFASHFSTDGLYGVDPPSFLWRGYGLTSQLYAIFFLPLGLAYTYKTLVELKSKAPNSKHQITNKHQIQSIKSQTNSFRILNFNNFNLFRISDFGFRIFNKIRASNLILASLFLTLTTAGHLGIGIIGLISTLPFLFLDLDIKNIIKRGKKLFIIYLLLLIALSYWIIPVLILDKYHMISFWDPIWKFNSYGWYEVVRQFLQGEIFDWQRGPVITGIVTVGFFALLVRNQRHSGDPDKIEGLRNRSWTSLPAQTGLDDNLYIFSLLFAFWMLMYFGRTTWGGLLDMVPGMKDFHLHRFIVGVHIAAIFLIPAGIEFSLNFINRILRSSVKFSKVAYGMFVSGNIANKSNKIMNQVQKNNADMESGYFANEKILHASKMQLFQTITFYIFAITFISILGFKTVQKTIDYAQLNNRWINEANNAYRYDEKNFLDLASYIKDLPAARVYAGRPGNWGHDFRLGSTQMYMMFGISGFDISQFLPETWSPLSENEQNFDERVREDFDLLNIKYLVTPSLSADYMKNISFPDVAKFTKQFGPFELREVPTTGWFDVVSSPMFVATDKTNYINLVHLWHRSFVRRWKMHPIISVEKNPKIPAGMQKVLQMTDEVSYEEYEEGSGLKGAKGLTPSVKSEVKNIFSDFPFVFPEATVSAKYIKEKVNQQTYSATVDVPENCKNCMIMFKMSYHPDWVAKMDGKSVEKFAVFPFYLAVQTTPGVHYVEFSYEPNKLKVLLIFFEVIILILTIVIILFHKKKHIH